ncbi:helix-turn-helix transcriptional regulator [Amycolatopsis sp. PS_44_ISF1]|uniref:helix-turn-helix domain-containing protein n=1 Tax=Amycolatopsis sp. PS_44_ISF1 TaxID=2974917 RepID=UPI0028DE5C9F|nr:helix-turn-helix transcriptional regulator [Amycolatopsis sp. PS_44_ISF1]MDT8913248.1 helix-turn-helix transcriptional regulator [Amycolatopsis sp. PS_44_ISF1]
MTLPSVETQQRELGTMISAARKRLGLTQAEFGRRVGYTQANISKLENAHLGLQREQLDAFIKALKVSDAEAAVMRRLNASASTSGIWSGRRLVATPPWFRDILAAEQEADTVRSWTGERISGQLQCESYMLTLFNTAGRRDIDDAVYERGQRARVFARHPKREYEFLLSESALLQLTRTRKLDPYILLDQVKHMLSLIDAHPGVSIRFVPFGELPHLPLDLTVFGFAQGADDFAYGETPQGVQRSTAETLRSSYLDRWTALSGAALSREDSRTLLEHAAREINDTRLPAGAAGFPALP